LCKKIAETAELDLADGSDEGDDDEEEGKVDPGFVEEQASASPAKVICSSLVKN
jgi:hypothetical protein